MSSIGALIQAARTERGWSQRRLAEVLASAAGRATVTRHEVSRWERGARTPRFWLPHLARVFDLDFAALEQTANGQAHPVVEHAVPGPVLPAAPGDLDDMVAHLREHWHVLVRTDNLFGPRHATGAVLDQITAIESLLRATRGPARDDLVSLAAQYAESAAWLHEDAAQMDTAGYWTGRAMEWAHEAGDQLMVAWTLFRRSQHAASDADGPRTLALARAAGRDADRLPTPMRAAILHQTAVGNALEGEETTTHRVLDEAHRWAAVDATGDARAGHGSFCTEAYLELQRAHCWLLLHRPDRAVATFDAALPHLPAVYRRDRGVACARLARAHLATGQPELAATSGHDALGIARSSGSVRTYRAVAEIGRRLAPHRRLPAVETFLHDLATAA